MLADAERLDALGRAAERLVGLGGVCESERRRDEVDRALAGCGYVRARGAGGRRVPRLGRDERVRESIRERLACEMVSRSRM